MAPVNSQPSIPILPAQSGDKPGNAREGFAAFTALAAKHEVYVVPEGTLTEFHLFSDLTIELRLRIWALYHADQQRIIEIEFGPEGLDPKFQIYNTPYVNSGPNLSYHTFCRASPLSRMPPAILQINKETRTEYLGVYQKTSFDIVSHSRKRSYCYFDPEQDIIYLGENTCSRTILRLIQLALVRGITIRRIAITLSKRHCCTEHPKGQNIIGREFNAIELLHGVSEKNRDPVVLHRRLRSPMPGCSGLKEVFFVQKSVFTPISPGMVDASTCFRPATGNVQGSKSKREVKETILSIRDRSFFERVGTEVEANWSGDKLPRFDFVSLNPKPTAFDPRIYGTFAVPGGPLLRFLKTEDQRQQLIVEGKKYACELTFPHFVENSDNSELPYEREIGLFGSKKGVEIMKQMLRKRAVDMESEERLGLPGMKEKMDEMRLAFKARQAKSRESQA